MAAGHCLAITKKAKIRENIVVFSDSVRQAELLRFLQQNSASCSLWCVKGAGSDLTKSSNLLHQNLSERKLTTRKSVIRFLLGFKSIRNQWAKFSTLQKPIKSKFWILITFLIKFDWSTRPSCTSDCVPYRNVLAKSERDTMLDNYLAILPSQSNFGLVPTV